MSEKKEQHRDVETLTVLGLAPSPPERLDEAVQEASRHLKGAKKPPVDMSRLKG